MVGMSCWKYYYNEMLLLYKMREKHAVYRLKASLLDIMRATFNIVAPNIK